MQGVVQQVGRRVGAADRLRGGRRRPRHEPCSLTVTVPSATWPMCRMKSFSFLVSWTSKREPLAADRAGVADLAAGLAVERRAIEDEDQRRSAVGLGPTRPGGSARGCR